METNPYVISRQHIASQRLFKAGLQAYNGYNFPTVTDAINSKQRVFKRLKLI